MLALLWAIPYDCPMRFAWFRWFIAAECVLASAWLMMKAMKIAGIGAAGHVTGSLLALVSAVLLTAPETAFRIAEWCSRPFTNLLFPSECFNRPPLSYRLARHYSGSLRLRDAVEEYRNIIYFYPDERQAYQELIEVAQRLEDQELCQKYAELFQKRFHVAGDVTEMS